MESNLGRAYVRSQGTVRVTCNFPRPGLITDQRRTEWNRSRVWRTSPSHVSAATDADTHIPYRGYSATLKTAPKAQKQTDEHDMMAHRRSLSCPEKCQNSAYGILSVHDLASSRTKTSGHRNSTTLAFNLVR